MSSDAAAKQALLEEKRRAARRAKILASGGSRLDTICGIVNTTPSSTSESPNLAPNTSSVPATVNSESEITSSPPVISSDPPIAAVAILTTSQNELSSETHSHSRTTSSAAQEETKPTSPPNPRPSAAPAWTPPAKLQPTGAAWPMQESSISSPPPRKAFTLTKSRCLLFGTFLAFIFGIVHALYSEYALLAVSIFWTLEILLWSRYEEVDTGNTSEKQAMLSMLMPASDAGGSPLDGLKKVYSLFTAAYSVGQDWLVSRFFYILALYLMQPHGPALSVLSL